MTTGADPITAANEAQLKQMCVGAWELCPCPCHAGDPCEDTAARGRCCKRADQLDRARRFVLPDTVRQGHIVGAHDKLGLNGMLLRTCAEVDCPGYEPTEREWTYLEAAFGAGMGERLSIDMYLGAEEGVAPFLALLRALARALEARGATLGEVKE